MPIKSYLAFPRTGVTVNALANAISSIDGCEVMPSSNFDVVVVISDTPNEEAENLMVEKLEQLPEMGRTALVNAFHEDAIR